MTKTIITNIMGNSEIAEGIGNCIDEADKKAFEIAEKLNFNFTHYKMRREDI